MRVLRLMRCAKASTLSIALLSACGAPGSTPSEGSAAADEAAETFAANPAEETDTTEPLEMPAAAPVDAFYTPPDVPVLGFADPVIETFHDSDTMKCGAQEVHITTPVRAFEDQNNYIHLIASSSIATGWQWTGSANQFTSNPKTAALDCTPVMNGNSANNDPTKFDQKTWPHAIYFKSTTVYAYGHEEYLGNRTSEPGCHVAGTSDGLPSCWYASVPVWTSSTTATHLSFARWGSAPNHGAIYPHVQYPGHGSTPSGAWIGYGGPSNIVRGRNPDGTLDGYHYMFVYAATTYAGQDHGVCLFRSADPTDRTSWRAWDGNNPLASFRRWAIPTAATTTRLARW